MRRWSAIARATAIEILSEPLSLLILLAALALTVLAPAFHYHQFGEPTRMARDAALSAIFTGGTLFAVVGIVRSFRREIESGTLAMALARAIARSDFFFAKVLGGFLAYLMMAVTLSATAVIMVNGARIGGALATQTGDIARVWGPSLALGVCVLLLPLVFGALLNRFAQFRFALSAQLLALTVALAGMAYRWQGEQFLRLLPALLTLVLFTAIALLAAAAFSVRLKANQAFALTALLVALLVPAIGNYYLADAFTGGGTIAWSYVIRATVVTLPALIAAAWLGVELFRELDVA